MHQATSTAPPTTTHRLRRAAGAALVAGAVAMTAAGCVSMDADLTLDSEGRADGSVEIALAKQAASMLGITSLDTFEQQMKSDLQDDLASSLAAEAVMDFSETDTSYVVTMDMRGAPLTEDDFAAGVQGEEVFFHFENEGDDSGMDMEMGTLTIEVTFPGELTQVSGAEQVDDDTIRFSGSFSDPVVIDARSEIDGPPVALFIGLGVVSLFVVGAVVLGIVLLTRRRPATAGPAGYPPPQGPQGYPQQGYPQQGHPQQGHPQQGHPQQAYPQQGHPPQGYPQQPPPQQPPPGQPPPGQPYGG